MNQIENLKKIIMSDGNTGSFFGREIVLDWDIYKLKTTKVYIIL